MLHISSFSIEGLNDLFHYQDCSTQGSLRDLIILYGENGSGKTTVLNLIFHLLSSQPQRGHLNAIAKIPFKSLRVTLSDNTTISAQKKDGVSSLPVVFKISRPNTAPIEYKFIPERYRDRYLQEALEREFRRTATINTKGKRTFKIQGLFNADTTRAVFGDSEEAHKKYISALQDLKITCYFMATDRRINSDAIEQKKSLGRPNHDPEDRESDVITRIRAQYLRDALASAFRYLTRQIISASNTGSRSTNDIYIDLINRIAREDTADPDFNPSERMKSAIKRLSDLESQDKRLSDLGILPSLDFAAINAAISTTPDANTAALAKILWPYIDSLNARINALNPVGDVIETFLRLINGLYTHKEISFSPTEGFFVSGPRSKEPLEAEQLSSGEQQLLLMFCYLLVSNENQSIFMIDEPEISLNVKWQRELVDAMRQITKSSNTQIIIATHSIELLAQFDDHVIALEPTISISESSAHDDTETDN